MEVTAAVVPNVSMQSMADDLLSTTRSVRKRLDFTQPVEMQDVIDCLRLAIQAPTASNRQRWNWLVVTDESARQALADSYRRAGADSLRNKRALATGQNQRVYDSAVYLADNLHRAPVLVVPCIEGRVEGMDNAEAAALYGSILPAVWSFMLALRARGLGAAWTTLHLRNESEAAAILGIPTHISQVALLPVAHTIGLEFKPATRPPIEGFIHWNRWELRDNTPR